MGTAGTNPRRWTPIAAAAALAFSAIAECEPAGAQSCTKRDFEQVVDDAAATIRDLNAKNRPAFQDRLRTLKDRRGWSSEKFIAEGAAYVQDDKITEYDQTSSDLLSRINSIGEEGSSAATPDCKLLAEVNAAMKDLVASQRAKWTYMFGKIDAALAK